jgi:hypothetical protein
MARAFETLAALGADGIQLTPGNMPTPAFEAMTASTRTRTHHGFTYRAFRTKDVWADDGTCTVTSDSVHPPRADAAAAAHFLDAGALPILETMYPGYALADSASLRDAMARGLALAVDVSHLHIQRTQGVLDDATLARVLDYDRIAEVHVSANDGKRDLHRSLVEDSFGLAWARAKLAAGTPVVLECYFHQLSDPQRHEQVDLCRIKKPQRKRLTRASLAHSR